MAAGEPLIAAVHRRRLRALWRSAGWPCQDMVEVELLAAGMLERLRDAAGRETLRVTDRGVALLAETLNGNRACRDAHEALVARVACEMQRAGRVVWRGLSLRAPVEGCVAGPDGATASVTRWAMAMPDVFSIRHTTLEDHVAPVVHEVKVRRADLLGDLKRPAKGEAYRALSSECWYVIRAGIGRPEEIPEVYGVMVAHPRGGEGAGRGDDRRNLGPPPASARSKCCDRRRDDRSACLSRSGWHWPAPRRSQATTASRRLPWTT